MPSIIMKKTFKIKGFQVAAEKAFTFHGFSVTPELISAINQSLSSIQYTGRSNRVVFGKDQHGHYYAPMNHDCQKYHEEDIISCILDVMEIMGWSFKFQYDSNLSSDKLNGSSFTSREMFMFHKGPNTHAHAMEYTYK